MQNVSFILTNIFVVFQFKSKLYLNIPIVLNIPDKIQLATLLCTSSPKQSTAKITLPTSFILYIIFS